MSERNRLPPTRPSITHRCVIRCPDHGAVKLFITVGLDSARTPMEIFITADQAGSTLDGFCDTWSITMSMALQHGVPLRTLIDKLSWTEFAPAGLTENPEIPIAKSIPDYVCRWMAKEFTNA